MLTEIEATPSSAKNITSLAKPLAISLVALAAGAGAWQSASVVGQQSPPFWRNCFHSCKASHRKHQCRKRACSTFSAVVALVFYPRKGCLYFGSIMPRSFYSDIREQHQDLVSQWPWLPDAFTLHGLVPSNPWRMLDFLFFNK